MVQARLLVLTYAFDNEARFIEGECLSPQYTHHARQKKVRPRQFVLRNEHLLCGPRDQGDLLRITVYQKPKVLLCNLEPVL
jgi:hypothetical protein